MPIPAANQRPPKDPEFDFPLSTEEGGEGRAERSVAETVKTSTGGKKSLIGRSRGGATPLGSLPSSGKLMGKSVQKIRSFAGRSPPKQPLTYRFRPLVPAAAAATCAGGSATSLSGVTHGRWHNRRQLKRRLLLWVAALAFPNRMHNPQVAGSGRS